MAASMLSGVAACSVGVGESLSVQPASASRQLRVARYEAIRGRLARCGENCLYLLARLHGYPVDYQQLLNELDTTGEPEDHFVSLRELRRAAERIGFACVVKRCSVEELEGIGLPAIVHYRFDPNSDIGREKPRDVGHYVLALEKNDRGFRLIDGSTLMIHHRSEDEFAPIWTGYVLVPRKDKIIADVSLTELGMIAVTIGFWVGVWRIVRKRPVFGKVSSGRGLRTSRIAIGGMAIFLGLGLASRATAGNASSDTEAGQVVWRTPENDARNCLYLMLRLRSHPVSYESLAAVLPTTDRGVTLTQLRDVARRFGLKVRIAKRAPGDLRRHRLPAIAHFDDGSSDGQGAFGLLLSCNEKECRYVAGDHVIYRRVSTDEFRRGWGAYVLEPTDASFWTSSLISVGVGSCVLGLYMVIRRPNEWLSCRKGHE